MRKDGGLIISSRRNTQSGYLNRGTILHKRYQIQDVIGQGGMGAVYRAKDLNDQERLYAIKEMSLSMVSDQDQPQAIQNFRVEAKILWGLNHPNLPTLEGFFSENGSYFLVMEYIDGDTLENYLERKGSPFPERRVLEWARQLCDVMEYLHSQRPPIIFRDMKPGNIMLSRSGQIKLIDFGIARFFRPAHTQDTQILGTPGYAPPEQYGKAQTDERSDVYALGMTLFHLLTNKLSEQGFGLENLHRDYPRISPNVARALEKATSIKPDDRFQSIAEFRHALFDVGVFVFESGDIVATPEEMAHLCVNYPEEAADYFYDGEIQAWLLDMGENELADIVDHAVKHNADPIKAVEVFVRAVAAQNEMGNILTRSNGSTVSINTVSAGQDRELREGPPHVTPSSMTARAGSMNNATGIGRRAVLKQSFPLAVNPRMLDFGTVFPGISAALFITITNPQGQPIRGTLHCYEPWIQLSKTSFDGVSTDISVRVNSLNLQRNQSYSGEIIIALEQDVRSQVVVKVKADVQGYIRNKRHPGRTHGADLDYDIDEADSLSDIPVVAVQKSPTHSVLDDTLDSLVDGPVSGKQMISPQVTPPELDPASIDLLKNLHEPASSPRQQEVLHLAMAFTCAFMTASLGYTCFADRNAPLLTRLDPQFILMLGTMIPAATFGALIVLYRRSWQADRAGSVVSRALTGMNGSLVVVALSELIRQLALRALPGWIQLLLMLVAASTGAIVAICDRPQRKIMSIANRVQRVFRKRRWMMLVPTVVVGGTLGYVLTFGFPFGPFTLFGILLAMGIVAGLAWRVSSFRYQMQKRQRQRI